MRIAMAFPAPKVLDASRCKELELFIEKELVDEPLNGWIIILEQ